MVNNNYSTNVVDMGSNQNVVHTNYVSNDANLVNQNVGLLN